LDLKAGIEVGPFDLSAAFSVGGAMGVPTFWGIFERLARS